MYIVEKKTRERIFKVKRSARTFFMYTVEPWKGEKERVFKVKITKSLQS